MKCKVGDMALIIKSAAGNEGKAVTCIELLGANPGIIHFGDKEILLMPIGVWWRVDRNLNMNIVYDNGVEFMEKDWAPFVLDHCLMPINGEVTDNETTASIVSNALV